MTIDLDHGLPFAKHDAGFAGKTHGAIFLFLLWTLNSLAKTCSSSLPTLRVWDTGAPGTGRMQRHGDNRDLVLTPSNPSEPHRLPVRASVPGLSKPRHLCLAWADRCSPRCSLMTA